MLHGFKHLRQGSKAKYSQSPFPADVSRRRKRTETTDLNSRAKKIRSSKSSRLAVADSSKGKKVTPAPAPFSGIADDVKEMVMMHAYSFEGVYVLHGISPHPSVSCSPFYSFYYCVLLPSILLTA
jgi:hypothetical protein